jgi:hypothetical protein
MKKELTLEYAMTFKDAWGWYSESPEDEQRRVWQSSGQCLGRERDGVIMLGEQEVSVCGKRVELKEMVQGLLKGEVSLHHRSPVWLVRNQLYDNWQF